MITVSLCNSGGELDGRTVHTPDAALEAAIEMLNHISALCPGDRIVVSGTYADEDPTYYGLCHTPIDTAARRRDHAALCACAIAAHRRRILVPIARPSVPALTEDSLRAANQS
jgi:hypothetical protein